MIRVAVILALLAVPLTAEEAPKPSPATEACSVCDLRQQAKRRLAAVRQSAQEPAKPDAPIMALPPAPKGD